jgi:phosphoribosylformylglycinamidine synthase
MVYRIYVEKKPGQRIEADALTGDLKTFLRLDGLKQVRVLNRYDVQHIDKALFDACKTTVFSEPQLDDVYETPDMDGAYAFAVEYLPGQFDQRADSASQCIQILSQSERPTVRTAKLYLIYGALSQQELAAVKKYLINPVESREASLEPVSTLEIPYQVPTQVDVLDQFLDLDEHGLEEMLAHYGLAMDLDDLKFCQAYFKQENRCPTITEIRMIDTYWSDHCRHTTFLTTIDSVHFEDALLQNAYEEYQKTRQAIGRTKPVTLMDIGTIAAKYLRQTGQLDKLDESEEINACTVRITVQTENGPEPWLLLFKNETHNHPTEIEPFGGAATCIGAPSATHSPAVPMFTRPCA